MQPHIASYPVRLVTSLPAFPDNALGLRRGSYIQSQDEELAAKLGFFVGQALPLCYDGKFIRCLTFGWQTIDDLVKRIEEGVWQISEKQPDAEEYMPRLEFQLGGQSTLHFFWKELWDTQEVLPERFKLQTAPEVTANELKAAATAAGKNLFIHAEAEPSKITPDGCISMTFGNSDSGMLMGNFTLTWDEMTTGDRFFFCGLKPSEH